jgi:hypothetical protein
MRTLEVAIAAGTRRRCRKWPVPPMNGSHQLGEIRRLTDGAAPAAGPHWLCVLIGPVAAES